MKNYKLTQTDLQQIISESVKRILKEENETYKILSPEEYERFRGDERMAAKFQINKYGKFLVDSDMHVVTDENIISKYLKKPKNENKKTLKLTISEIKTIIANSTKKIINN